jgi:hypothetical protein
MLTDREHTHIPPRQPLSRVVAMQSYAMPGEVATTEWPAAALSQWRYQTAPLPVGACIDPVSQ